MSFTNIDDPSAHFQIALWTGNTTAPRSITNDGTSDLKPDIVWAKLKAMRDGADLASDRLL